MMLATMFQRLALFVRPFFLIFLLIISGTVYADDSAVLKTRLTPSGETALGQQFKQTLVAELYNKLGYPALATDAYVSVVMASTNLNVIKRGTELAARAGQSEKAQLMAEYWVKQAPKGLDARQYLALLALRRQQYDKAASQLFLIYNLVEEVPDRQLITSLYSKGLSFIGSMLSIESHHKEALAAFQHYLERYSDEMNETQQNLVLATLAMKAKQYPLVVQSLNKIKVSEPRMFQKVALMKVNALKQLNQLDEAIQTLQTLLDQKKLSDKNRLELVKLFIMNKQKMKASHHLKQLVKKYPENQDLLKSLIALEIDRSQLLLAKENIARLRQHENYFSDAEYFTAEVLEAEGKLESALSSYLKVEKGKLHKRAQKKVIRLKKLLAKQGNAKNVKYKRPLPSASFD